MCYYCFGFSVGYYNSIISACKRVRACGGKALQITFKDPSDFRAPNFELQNAEISKKYIVKHKMQLVNHSQYTINFAKDPEKCKLERSSLINDLENCSAIGGVGCVIHMGKLVPKYNLTLEQGIENMASNIVLVVKAAPKDVLLLLETPAGQGNEMCTKLRDMAKLYNAIPKKYRDRIAFCIDTCHIYAAGTCDLNESDGWYSYINEWDRRIGIDKIALIHLNNSMDTFNGRKDRHAELTNGCIESDQLRDVVLFAKENKIPFVLETHSDRYDMEMKTLHSWLQNKIDLTTVRIVADEIEADVSERQMMNAYIADELERLSKVYLTTGVKKDFFKSKAYKTAATAIRNCTFDITCGKDAMKLNGVGPSTAEKIQQLLDDGQIKILADTEDEMRIKQMFMMIWGAGAKRVNTWYDDGCRTLEDLKDRDDVTNQQRIGIKYYDDIPKRIPYKRVARFNDKLQEIVANVNKDIIAQICGSFRRKCKTCGDIDILISSKKGKDIDGYLLSVVNALKKAKIIVDELTTAKTNSQSYNCMCKLDGHYHRMDIKVYPKEQWPFALLYFTGCYQMNERHRYIAKRRGYRLSDHRLEKLGKDGKPVKDNPKLVLLETEQDIFGWLGEPYLEPEQRVF